MTDLVPSPPALSGECEEMAAHLRQLAEWVAQAVQDPISLSSIDLGDIDTGELRKAASLIERQEREIVELKTLMGECRTRLSSCDYIGRATDILKQLDAALGGTP